jgi:hypothetical protein
MVTRAATRVDIFEENAARIASSADRWPPGDLQSLQSDECAPGFQPALSRQDGGAMS